MFEVFKKYLGDKIKLTAEDYALIESFAVFKKLRKHQYLLQEGDVWRYNAFVCQGCLRNYRIDDKGSEHILQFSIESWWAGDRESLLTGQPSKSNIEAIEDTIVLLFTKDNFELIKNQIPNFKDFVNVLIDRSFIAFSNRIHANISQTAEEKYVDFIKSNPQVVNRIPQHMIASYLGISPETLSRVRKQTAKR